VVTAEGGPLDQCRPVGPSGITAVSRVERGVVAGVPEGRVERLVVALGGELDIRVRWRGEELDRLLDATHAAIGETLVEVLAGLGWECAVEATFAIRGEYGSVDVLALHRPTGRLLVVESKSVVPDLQKLLGSLDRKVRLAREIAAQRGWRSTGVARAIVRAGTTANRARAERFGATLRAVLPDNGRALRRWLARPEGRDPAALWFIMDRRVMTAIKRRRVRPRRTRNQTRNQTSGQKHTSGVSTATQDLAESRVATWEGVAVR
jgi:hypothetical protein